MLKISILSSVIKHCYGQVCCLQPTPFATWLQGLCYGFSMVILGCCWVHLMVAKVSNARAVVREDVLVLATVVVALQSQQ